MLVWKWGGKGLVTTACATGAGSCWTRCVVLVTVTGISDDFVVSVCDLYHSHCYWVMVIRFHFPHMLHVHEIKHLWPRTLICSSSTVKLGADSCKTATNKQKTILLHFLCTLSWSNTKHVYWKCDTSYIFSLPMGNMSNGTAALSTRTGSGIQLYLSDWIHCGGEESPGIYLHLHCRLFEQFAMQLVTSYEFMCLLLWSPRQSSFLKSCCNCSICSNLSSCCKGVSQCFGALPIIYYSIDWKVGAGWLEPIERLYIQLKLEHGV